jgi:hypothetical protein
MKNRSQPISEFCYSQKAVAVLLVLLVLGLSLAAFAHGPIGPESIISKEVSELIDDAAVGAKARVAGLRPIGAANVPLSTTLETKRVLKVLLSKVHLVEAVPESAAEYTFVSAEIPYPIRFMVRFRGDHVLAVGLDRNAPIELIRAIRSKFPGYTVYEISA